MKAEDFDRLQALVASRAGYKLSRSRMHLASHRLAPVARREGFESVDALLEAVWSRPIASLGWAVIEAMLNIETWFRRDRAAYDTLRTELLPALARARGEARPLRLLSAGCATGQEAYSLAIVCAEAGVDAQVVGIDLSHLALERARAGAYTPFEIQRGLSARLMLSFFDKAGESWRAKAQLRAMVEFERANLLDAAEADGRFDIVFCRHVLSEMEPARRTQALERIDAELVDDGCLFLAPAERVESDTLAFRAVAGRRGLYVKGPSSARRAA